MDVEDLLAGPRGRRLCLEWALRLSAEAGGEDELGTAVLLTSHDMNEPGVSWVFAWKDGTESDDLPGPSTPAEIAALLGSVPLRAPNDRELLTLLAQAVSTAMYWQPPWGEDVLTATPEVRAALAGAAESILDSPLTDWWESTVDPAGQWSVERVMPDDWPAEPPPLPAAELLEQFGREVTEERLAYQDGGEESYGHWWSIPPIGLTTSTRGLEGAGPLGLWCEEDGMGFERSIARRIVPPRNPHILEITGPRDWAGLCAAFPLDVTASRRTVWGAATGRNGLWLVPDWPALAASGVDGVHLTVAGYLTTAGLAVDVTDTHSSVLAGWAPDITVWLTDVATAGDPVVWRMETEADLDFQVAR